MLREDIINTWLAAAKRPPLTEGQATLFSLYQNHLLEACKYMNLTAITDETEIAIKHFIDSLTILPWIYPGADVLDLGTGAGFPGIPIKIMEPGIGLALLDGTLKRVKFLQEIVDLLGFTNVSCIHARAEELLHTQKHPKYYDICTARAVAKLGDLARYGLPLLKKGGLLLAMKGPDIEMEITEALPIFKKLRGVVEEVKKFVIPGGIGRSVVVVKRK